MEFEGKIDSLHLGLFDAIHSQSLLGDRRSWLALQRAKRKSKNSYVYLEIGSDLGGSIQPYLLDPKCRKIYSIDLRPLEVPDDRGVRRSYEGNSTERMLANLRRIDPHQVSKIVCFDSDAKEVDPQLISEGPDLCFIDGEHTKAAVLSDSDFCLRVCAPNAIIYFHDDAVIYPALDKILRSLNERQTRHCAFKLQGVTFAIALGDSAIIDNELQEEIVAEGHQFVRKMQMRRLILSLLPGPLLPAARGLRRLFQKMMMSISF
jgi:hypothetical protein